MKILNDNGVAGAMFLIVFLLVLGGGGYYLYREAQKDKTINSFADCVAAGNPVMESYPEQCNADGRNFINPNQSLDQPE